GISGPTVIPGQYLSVPENVWASVNYVPAGWISGAGAVGYENRPGEAVNYSGYINTGINLQSQMYNKATSCYIRIPFSYTSSDINSLKLNLRYDDGCVVYLNGIEVYRDNVDGVVLNWNSQADLPRDDSISIAITQVDISQNIDLLRNGNNVLAIQGLNDAAGSSDMLISASLVAGVQDPGQVSALAEEYAGPVTLNISKEINTRIFDGLEWSPLTKASFSVGPVSESLRITELMYHSELNGVEFLEIRNIGASAVNLNKVSFIKGISHIFGDLWLEPDQFIVLTQDSIAFAGRYPALPADCIVLQWDSGLLNNAGEEIVFCDASGEVIQAFEYNDWYDLTDGGGFTMNMPDPAQADLSLWSQKESWAVSTYAGGSPGELDEALTGNSIVINEVMSNPTEGMPDWVELKNNTSMPINIGGWYLSDSNSDLLKYQIEQGTVVPASGYLVLYDEMSFGSSLGLSKFGENLTLSSAVNGVLTGYQVSEDFDAAPEGVSYGRYQKSDGSFNFVLLLEATPGRANSVPGISPLVISEIMYNPAGDADAEYIELKNISAASLQLRFEDPLTAEILPWRIIDEDGVIAVLPTNVTLLRGQKFLLIKDISAYVQEYGSLSPYVKYMEWSSGKLSNSGEKIELQIPGELDSDMRTYIRADRVN
ncbi:MAG: lamin tail domain-containing protein, partial [Sedimentisphaerales bacterium]|nr:lamin tail domain-containing protein [Sedimentisphaerales bacterium]